MKILHTSDWHLGRSLYGRKRYEEFEAFLDWLSGVLRDEAVDVLLVAGDIFDTTTPGNRAQQLYYRFLCRMASTGCRHAVVIAGNHDSPSFLEAPKELLGALNVHVIGQADTERPEDEVLELKLAEQTVLVCAVPYLRDKDIRLTEAGETGEESSRKLLEGIRLHYQAVGEVAEKRRAAIGQARRVPIIGMGHLYTAGGTLAEGDGVRDLYVGTVAHISGDIFPPVFDYCALGHLHVPQKVNGSETLRYSGSPLPMGFGEAGQRKSVVLLDFDPALPSIRLIDIPVFQELISIAGDLDTLVARIAALRNQGSAAWLELDYTGSAATGNLREVLDEAVAGSRLEIRRIRNRRVAEAVLGDIRAEDTLDDLDAEDIFERCLEANGIPGDERPALFESYRQLLRELGEADTNAE